ncbi:MAG: hypothetical protein ABIK99_00930 [candidate division WOR-3 bacterium]
MNRKAVLGVPRRVLLLATQEAEGKAKGEMLLKAEEKATQEAR